MKGLINTQILIKFLVFPLFFQIFLSHTQGNIENNPAYQEVMAKTSAVNDPDKQIGEFDPSSSPNLPIGLVKEIGGVKYIIAIDSAYFLNNGAYFSAYMAIEFPNANKKLAFAAKNIQFNPKGVVGGNQAKLVLVSDHEIEIGPNTLLQLRGDGSNFVNWNCNGFESLNIKGNFLFSKNLLQPTDGRERVEASFETNIVDIHNLLTAVNISPFTIKGINDYEFEVSSAYVDMSDFTNPPAAPMPAVYNTLYPQDINLWRGFYLKNFIVKLPEKISKEDERKSIYARDLFIDDAGITGFFGANNVLNLGDGRTNGNWGLSVELIEMGFTTNELTSGTLKGKIEVPFLDNNALKYGALISKNEITNQADYLFSVSAENDMSVEGFFSKLTLYPTSNITMSVIENKFKPRLNLNGKWQLAHKNAKFSGVTFQHVEIISEAPYLSSGLFSLQTQSTSEMGKFGISLDKVSLGVLDAQPTLRATVGLNFGQPDDANNISVAGSFNLSSKVKENLTTNKQEWRFDRFKINRIDIAASVSNFSVDGFVDFKEDDPIYGDGFQGKLALELGDFLPKTTMFCMFGKMPDYKYWAIDATVPVNIKVAANVKLVQLTGGVSRHVENTLTAEEIMTNAGEIGDEEDALSPNYIPNKDVGFGFRAGVGYSMIPETVLNGEVMLSIEFNEHGGLRDILFAGSAYMMTSRAQRNSATSYARGLVSIYFDNMAKVFDARFDLEASFENALTANIWSQIYISPGLWYAHLGTPSSPCSVNLLNFATASSYFMFGQNLPPMPDPPPQVSDELGVVTDDRDESAIASGNGVGTGMNFMVGFDESVGFDKFSIYGAGYIGAGFDMTLYKYSSSAYCSESGDDFGANNWYLNGQLYAYGSVNVGLAGKLAGKDFDFEFINASMAMLLQGKLPKPTFVYGGINVKTKILGILSVNETFEFELGDNCTIVE